MRETFANIGISVATNTALFTGLDLGQWIADTFSLWSLPANLTAAVIATAFGLVLSAASQMFSSIGVRAATSADDAHHPAKTAAVTAIEMAIRGAGTAERVRRIGVLTGRAARATGGTNQR